jgi:hypothetical protein
VGSAPVDYPQLFCHSGFFGTPFAQLDFHFLYEKWRSLVAMTTGIEHELESIQLGDQRLNNRARSLLKTLAADSQNPINAACSGWSESKAAYRFFDNDNVEPLKILQAHREATAQRAAKHPVILVAQDTTELDFSDHPPADIQHLNTQQRRGLYNHTSLVLTPAKLPLGVLHVELFDRDAESLGKSAERSSDPIETKESYRWLQGYRQCCDLAGQCPESQVVSIADREGDIYDIFSEVQRQETAADFVIRSRVARSLPEKDPSGGADCYKKIRSEVAAGEVRHVRQIELPATPKRKARTANLEIRAESMRIKPPHARAKDFEEVTLSVVEVREIEGPEDGTDLHWVLLSSLPVDQVEEVLQIVDIYVARWVVEMYFRVLKSGCRVEEIQLETRARLERALMLYQVIAWRVMFVTIAGRECPDLPCDALFEIAEWESVWRIAEKATPPEEAPSLERFMPVLAQLGGYNRRKADGPIGSEVIWRAIRRMKDFALAWHTFQDVNS